MSGAGGGMTKPQQRRQRKLANYYKVQELRTMANKKKRVRKHLRNNPSDNAWTADIGLTARGKRLQERSQS
jgi:ribosomal protein S15P/S13E